MTMKQIRSLARRLVTLDRKRDALMAERDGLMRQAKQQGATWEELQDAAGMKSPTAVSRSLKRGS